MDEGMRQTSLEKFMSMAEAELSSNEQKTLLQE
jgi:hypothetical protein